jgi:ribosomal-protein-alanine N-acetyltransferase
MDFNQYFNEFPSFTLSKCILRKIETKDAEHLYKYYNNINVFQHLDWNGPSSIHDAIEIINRWNQGYSEGWIIRFGIVEKESDKIIGTIFLNGFDGKRSEIGYELSENYWKKGIMSEAIMKIIDLGFNTLGRTRIQATVCNENIASEHILIKHGFQYEGLLRQYEEHYITKQVKDMKLYSIIKNQ